MQFIVSKLKSSLPNIKREKNTSFSESLHVSNAHVTKRQVAFLNCIINTSELYVTELNHVAYNFIDF